MKDLFGQALLDFYQGNYSDDIMTETSISEEDVLPLPYLFRSYAEMPSLERKALDETRGTVLDVGCGAGCHALRLQEMGLKVTAIDLSEGAVEVSRLRGVKQVFQQDVFQLKNKKFDTILALMNGAGILENMEKASQNLQHIKTLLAPGGQFLVDSSDLQYMYDRGEDGGILVPADRYYGELDYLIRYKGIEGEPFPWLYIDEIRLERLCHENDLNLEVIDRGQNFDYLARITAREHSQE